MVFVCNTCNAEIKDKRGLRGHMLFKHKEKVTADEVHLYFKEIAEVPVQIDRQVVQPLQQPPNTMPTDTARKVRGLERVKKIHEDILEIKEMQATERLLDTLEWGSMSKNPEIEALKKELEQQKQEALNDRLNIIEEMLQGGDPDTDDFEDGEPDSFEGMAKQMIAQAVAKKQMGSEVNDGRQVESVGSLE